MKQINIILLAFIALLASCNTDKSEYENATTFNYSDFKSEKDLQGTTLEFDSLIMQPVDLLAFDSILITIEMGKENIFHVYNMKTKTHINQCIKRGQGPNDMLYPEFINASANSIRIIDSQTSTVYEYDVEDFITNPTPTPTKRTKLEKQIFITANQVEDKIMGCTYGVNERIYVFDLNGVKTDAIVSYPPTSISQTDREKMDAYYMKFISNDKDKIAVCYYMTDLIEIYNLEGVLQKRIHGPEQFYSHFKEFQDGPMVSSSSVKGMNRDAFMCPKNAGDEFFVLFNGGNIDDPDHTSSVKRLFSFSWDGVPQNRYNLNDPIYSFSIDSKNKTIYGISETPEYHVVKYSYE